MPDDQALRTKVWLLQGLSASVPGLLELVEGRLALTTDAAREFEVPLGEVADVKFPWHYFGGGMHLTVGGQSYRLSFVKPNNAGELVGTPSFTEGLLTAGHKIADVGEGRAAGRAWKAALSQQGPPHG